MICAGCNKDLCEKDFLPKQNACFRCIYFEKIKNKKTLLKRLTCKNCNQEFTKDIDLKKRQHTVFCSPQCAKDGYRLMRLNHWTKQLRSNSPMCF